MNLPAQLAVFGLGPAEIVLILVVLLLLFGGKKLPELARGLGKSLTEFKKASKEADTLADDIESDAPSAKKPAAKTPPTDPNGGKN